MTVLERTDTLGKKLLSTGNGRCNLTNRAQAPSFYHCNEENFPLGALKRFPLQAVLDFFESLGLSFKEREGYVYPRSLKASSVRDALLSELRVLGADVRTGAKVTGIFRDGNRLLVKTAETSFGAEGVILACGGKAFPASGSDGSGYLLAEKPGTPGDSACSGPCPPLRGKKRLWRRPRACGPRAASTFTTAPV